MKPLIHSQKSVFQNPNSEIDFHWFNGSSYKHLHDDYYELIVIIEGEFSHDYLGKTRKLSRGDAVLIKPQYYHLQTSDQQKSLLANFSITINTFNSLIKAYNEEAYKNLKKHSGEPVRLTETEINYLVDALNKNLSVNPHNDANLDFFHLSIIHWVLGLMNLNYSRSDSNTSANLPDWLNRFLEKLHNPEIFCLPLSQIYSLTIYSQSRLIYLFKQNLGIPLVKYITKLKIDYAKNLLVKTSFSVLDITYTLNYSSISHFITLFKKHTGFTPTEYRQRFYIDVNPYETRTK